MPDIIHRIGIHGTSEQVYRAIATTTGLAGWWTNEVEGSEEKGGQISFTFRAAGREQKGKMIMETIHLDPAGSIRWRCVDGPAEWIGTDITFEWKMEDSQTILLFGHRNWRESVEFMAHCSTKWAVFLLSFRDYIEAGKGRPSPNDFKIDNWN